MGETVFLFLQNTSIYFQQLLFETFGFNSCCWNYKCWLFFKKICFTPRQNLKPVLFKFLWHSCLFLFWDLTPVVHRDWTPFLILIDTSCCRRKFYYGVFSCIMLSSQSYRCSTCIKFKSVAFPSYGLSELLS